MSGGWSGGGPAYPVPGGFGAGVGATARYFLEGAADPSAGAGAAAPIGSLYLRDNAGVGETWRKAGAADTAWSLAGDAGLSSEVIAHCMGYVGASGSGSKVMLDTLDQAQPQIATLDAVNGVLSVVTPGRYAVWGVIAYPPATAASVVGLGFYSSGLGTSYMSDARMANLAPAQGSVISVYDEIVFAAGDEIELDYTWTLAGGVTIAFAYIRMRYIQAD